MGKNCHINQNVKFYNGCSSKINIEDNVYISFDVKFLGTTHEIGTEAQRAGKTLYKPIIVGTGCWIGAGVTILPGISIGKGCIIGAGTLVTKNCEPNTVYVGVPARPIRKL